MNRVNIQDVFFTPADAGRALDTIARLERDDRGIVAVRLMYSDPREPPRWWHVLDMCNLTLLARTVAVQEGTAPAPGNPHPSAFVEDPLTAGASLMRLKAKLMEWKNGTEPIPSAVLPTYEGQTRIDIGRLDYRHDRPEPNPDPLFHEADRRHMESTLIELLEEIHPTEETIHGARRQVCYEESDLNIRVVPDYYFAKGVPGPGIKATGPYLIWVVGKPPDFALEMASPSKAREDLTSKRKLYRELGIAEYWRLDPTGGELYGAPLSADRLEDGIYRPISLHRPENDLIWGHSQAAGINIFWVGGQFVYKEPGTNSNTGK